MTTVSVIVPTRNRVDLLSLLLDAMSQQTYHDFELVLIDDGSTQDVQATVAKHALGIEVRYIRTEGVGAVEARCRGIAQAQGRILAFTDSDCEPEPRWLEEGVAVIDSGADAVQGVTLPARGVGLLERTISYSGGEGLFATCNMFYTRTAYDSAGGFDKGADTRWRFRADEHAQGLGFGEDSLLGWRVARTGVVKVAEKAIVRHAVSKPPLKEQFSRAWQVGAFPALIREIPELRDTLLKRRLFLQSRDRLPLYAAGAAFLVRRRRPAWFFLGAWAALLTDGITRRSSEPAAERIAALPIEAAIEVTKAVALVVGSLRSRTPVL